MNLIGRLKKAIGLSQELEAREGLGEYARHLTNNARVKLRNRRREVVQRESRRVNFRRARGSKWRGR